MNVGRKDEGALKATSDGADEWLPLSEAAARLETSHAYVWMLCSQGQLGEVDVTSTGQRRIRLSAVNDLMSRWANARIEMHTLQEAAQQAGMYDIPEERYAGSVREEADRSHSDSKASQ